MVNLTTKESLLISWDKNIKKYHEEANFLQSSFWSITNEAIGHKAIALDFNAGECSALCIIKSARRGRYLEIPGGPLIDWSDSGVVTEMMSELKKTAKANKCAFVRLRPQLLNTPENLELLKGLELKPSPMHLHAEHTVIIDLKKSEDELLSNMRRQTRYEVRRAEKLKLKVDSRSADSDSFKELLTEFYETQQKTASRQHFIPPSKRELEAECNAFSKNASLYVARTEEGEPVAYGLILKYGKEADYFEAASTDLNRKLPGAYALLWQAMKDLKAEGYERFNLWGIAPAGQPNHRYAKVTTFKTGFGGEVVNFVPAHDLVISKVKYLPNLLVETARKRHRHL